LLFHHWLETRGARQALSRAASSVHGIGGYLCCGVSHALVAAQDELVRPSRLIEAEAVSARQEGVIVLGGGEREGNLK
jgi:hypothetical protein